MKKIKTVAVLGAGALGVMYMEAISEAEGIEAFFLAGKERARRLRETDFSINGRSRRFAVKDPREEECRPDLIILAVKNYHLEETLPLLREVTTPGTVLVSVLNGISSEALLEEAFPEAEVLYCAVLGMDAVKEGELLSFTSRGKFLIGSREHSLTAPLELCAALLEDCGLPYYIPEDIHKALWYKWMINIGVNQVSAVTGARYGEFQKNPDLRELMIKAMREVIDTAAAEEVDLTDKDLEAWYAVLEGLGPEGKTSMLQDMEAGRRTEVDSFAGELIRRAARGGIAVPVNETLYTIIKTRTALA